jgi:hypothetical protein
VEIEYSTSVFEECQTAARTCYGFQNSIQGQFNLKICYIFSGDIELVTETRSISYKFGSSSLTALSLLLSSNFRKILIAVFVQTPSFLAEDNCSSESTKGKVAC